jgi:hypothetical protein
MSTQKRQNKQKGGAMDYPFVSEHHQYPIPSKVDFPISKDVATNFVSNNDLYGCGLKEGMWTTNGGIVRGGAGIVRGGSKKQKGGNCGCNGMQRGGDCGCGVTSMQLGGGKGKKQNKQKGAGYGYSLDMAHPITNMPEVVRYPTDTAYQNVDTIMTGAVIKGGVVKNEYLSRVANGNKKGQKGGSGASDSLMEYFIDFQHRCRGSEIY